MECYAREELYYPESEYYQRMKADGKVLHASAIVADLDAGGDMAKTINRLLVEIEE